MHEDANASVPDFYFGVVFCKEKTFGFQLPRLPELRGLGKREKYRSAGTGERTIGPNSTRGTTFSAQCTRMLSCNSVFVANPAILMRFAK